MKPLYFALAAFLFVFASCSKRDYYPVEDEAGQWMRTHDRGVVALVDDYTGNYIVETTQGFAVVELWGGIEPREYDEEYAYFSRTGVQTVYNYQGDYFTKSRVVDYWLSWSDALYVLDELAR